MPYKVRCQRNDDGSYILSYGKGSLKMTATLTGKGNAWQVSNGTAGKKKRELIEQWGTRAAQEYGGATSPVPDDKAPVVCSTAVAPASPRDDAPEEPVRLFMPGTVPLKVIEHGLYKTSTGIEYRIVDIDGNVDQCECRLVPHRV